MIRRVTAGPLVAGGDSLVRRRGDKTMFVEGAVPGEVVDVEVSADRRDVTKARVVDVLEPSPRRVAPPCRTFDKGCGGCQWQHIDIDAQHGFKVDIVRDALRRIAKTEEIEVVFGGAVTARGYRTNMSLASSSGRAALRRRHSNDLVVLDECVVAHPLLEQEMLSEARPSTTMRVSATDGTVNGTIYEEVSGHRFRISEGAFFQSGVQAAQLLVDTVDRLVPADVSWIVDAYAGVGLFGAVIGAERNARVSAIESSGVSASDARHNLAHVDAEVIESEVAVVELAGDSTPDVIIADPPRTGLGRSATRALAAMGTGQLILISCDPASLARDVNLLGEHGYRARRAVVLDVFPHTHHVETVTHFVSKN